MAKQRPRTKASQLHLLDRRPPTHRVWQAMPAEARKEAIQLLAMMLQQRHEANAAGRADDE